MTDLAQGVVSACVLSAPDDSPSAKWSPVPPEQIPQFVIDRIGDLLAHPDECVRDDEVDPRWFRVVRVTDPRLVGNQLAQRPRIILPH